MTTFAFPNFYPSVGFYFELSILGERAGAFQEVSGISAEYINDEINPGGENQYQHKLPTHPKYENLVLKRGVTPTDSLLPTWCYSTLSTDLLKPVAPRNIEVRLLTAEGVVMKEWRFFNAYPVRYNISEFSSKNNDIAVEVIEFAYSYFEDYQVTL